MAYENTIFPMYLAQTVHEDAKAEVHLCSTPKMLWISK
jgi:hypothetical protein